MVAGARALFSLSTWINFHTQPCFCWLFRQLTSVSIPQDELSIPFPQQHDHGWPEPHHYCPLLIPGCPSASKSKRKWSVIFHVDCNNFSLTFMGLCHLILLSSPANSSQSTEVNDVLMQCCCCKVFTIFVVPKESADRSLCAFLCAIQSNCVY